MFKGYDVRLHIFLTIILGAVSVLVNCFISLFITPKITNAIGIEAYGYVTLAKNFVMYAAILTTALNSYAARYMSVVYLKGEKEIYKKYTSTVFIGDLVIGMILLFIGIIFAINADKIIHIEKELVHDVKLLFILSFTAFFFNTISTVYTATGYVKDRIEIINIIKTCSYIVEIIVLVICFWLITPVTWYVGIASLSMSMVVLLGSYVMTKKLIPEIAISIKYFNNSALKELVINGLWNSANSLGNALNTGLDLMISNLMLNNIAMGQVSVAKTINNIIFALYAAISQAFQPKLLRHYSDGNMRALVKELKLAMRTSGIITNCIFAGFIAIGFDFLSLWLPGQEINTIYLISVIAMMPCITEGCVYPLYYIYTLTVKNKIPCLVTILGGFLNVISMYILIRCTNLGIYSVVITTAVIMNIIGLITNPIYVCRCLDIKKRTFYPDIVFNVFCLSATTLVLIYCKRCVIGLCITWKVLIIEISLMALTAFLVQLILVCVFRRIVKKVRQRFEKY